MPKQPVFVKGTPQAINAEKQIMLKEQGLYSGKIDGDWGRLSKAAWRKYQDSQQTKDTTPPAPEIKVGQPVQQQERPQKYYKNVKGVITEVDKDTVGAMTYEEAVNKNKPKKTLSGKTWGYSIQRAYNEADRRGWNYQQGGSHNAQSQTKKPVTQTNDKRDYIAENNVSYQWSDAPINTTPLLIPSAYETTQGGSDSEAAPIQEQLILVKLAKETLDPAYEDQLRALYNTTPHQVLYKYDKDYRNRMDYNASQNPYKIQYPKTDLRRGDNIPPNTAWMYPNLTGQTRAAMTTQANQDLAFDIMGAGMASKYFKGAKGVNDIVKVFKPAKELMILLKFLI